ncbi:MAG: sigma-54 dependent transcriptional regulator [Desulfopila sp.]|jgi:DNA-binding NtrC family response regulator|nr:sigma-54 dependent transcriptional regulator [Desulfopila sp.]
MNISSTSGLSDRREPQEKVVRIIVVDDEKDFARGLVRHIGTHFDGVDVFAVHSGREALKLLGEQEVQLLITDLRMPEMNGMELIHEALANDPGLSIVVLSAHGTIETAVKALHAGAYDFLTKPFEPAQLFRVIRKSLERSRLLDENIRLRRIITQQDDGKDELVGEGPAIQQLRRAIATIAQSDYNVLVRGESGTGKELVAGMIHRLGGRADKPFIAVDCPSIPENLLESELFGYVKGAFTGADRNHRGLFAAAQGGVLHLDEIGDISPVIQTKLLRCLQNGEVRPVGANSSLQVDVRIVASTNQNLEDRIREKSFREDLYYRLNVLSLTLPPLRERLEDVPLLAMYVLRRACRESGLPNKELTGEVLEWMSRRPWPGNVRELQNFVRRLMVFSHGDVIDMNLVRVVLDGGLPGKTLPHTTEPTSGALASYKAAKEEVINDFTRRYIDKLLRATQGNVSEAARVSGLSRVALQKILTRLGDNAARYR